MAVDYQAVRDLNVFSNDDFSYVNDFDANHFHKWCVEVLVADFWDLFKEKEHEEAQHKRRVLIYIFRQHLAKGYYWLLSKISIFTLIMMITSGGNLVIFILGELLQSN